MASGEGPGVARRLGEADQEQGDGGRGDRRQVILYERTRRQHRERNSPGHIPDRGDAVSGQVEELRREEPPDDEHERTRHLRRPHVQRDDHDHAHDPDDQRRPVQVVERPHPFTELAPGVLAPRVRARQLGELADDDIDRRAEQEAGDDRLRQEPRDPSDPKRGGDEKEAPVAIVIAATSSAVAWPDDTPEMTTAPAATAASPELGPVEICREVPKIA